MLRSIGKTSKSFFMKLLVSIMILPFVFWGMGDLFSGGNQNTIVTISKDKIATDEFINYINRNHTNEDERINKIAIDKHLATFIGEKLILKEIEDFDIKLSDKYQIIR